MSLPNRRFLLALPLLGLAACGFQPVYGPSGTGTVLQNSVAVDPPGDVYTYILVREVETRLGRPAPAKYGLALTVSASTEGLAVDTANSTRRYNLIAKAGFTLRDLETGQIVSSGNVENFTGYSATGSTVATFAAERDARKRLITMLADQIVNRLYAVDLNP
ncbi:LPS-assembly lipoprotein [Sulfitobacter marinus]|uniref:LPS-assembly lipoprotein n=1 Tax=Sulfitobacter marinus TaxID=394264 RepID=A0A1I6TJZ1_9RHOB|nr:LPS assembly lipoprotein LptE [Sulfitobacter marinus]SFS89553.1 LPS-assembly lipoprotein [Sulfitobacter marinus]